MKGNIIKEKSFRFAVRIANLYTHLCEEKHEYTLSKQALRSGTSVGAMVREAEHAESKADFIHKMAIAQKEINETMYWHEILCETGRLSAAAFDSLNNDAVELLKLLTRIIKTAKTSLPINH
jgi:four helix bundle protein